jgi:predicted RNA-binding Zn-ribbon protein involved in translation (DUF1610 family)
MPELISLVCPSCGGKLKVSKNATSMTCQHCGTEHMVKHDAGGVLLEAYARCPQCGRNDKSEKVTAIIASQTQEITGTEQKNEVTVGSQGQQSVVIREVPFTRTQVSYLGQRLAPPPDPQYHPDVPPAPSRGGLVGWVVLLVLIGLAAGVLGLVMTGYSIVSIGSYSLTNNTLFYIFFGLFIFIGALAFIGGAVLLGILGTRRFQKKYQEYQDLIKKIAQEVEKVNSDWKRALNRWDQLYYCSRDDCVFIPGDNSSAPISQLKEYVYK